LFSKNEKTLCESRWEEDDRRRAAWTKDKAPILIVQYAVEAMLEEGNEVEEIHARA